MLNRIRSMQMAGTDSEADGILLGIEDFCQRYFANSAPCPEESVRFDRKTWEEFGNLGIFRLPVKVDLGGLEQSMNVTARAVETVARYCPDEGILVSLVTHLCSCVVPLQTHGSPEQIEKYLEGLIDGSQLGANAMTEANGGSSVSEMRTMIRTSGNSHAISGSKIFVTNGPIANTIIVYARHPNGLKNMNITAVLVERDTPGLSTGQVWSKMGINSSPTSEIVLEDIPYNKKAVLGRERRGLDIFNTSMTWERVIISAYHLGAMKRQFNQVLDYANTRMVEDRPIVTFQEIARKLVGMKCRIDSGSLLLEQVCDKYEAGTFSMADASMLKLTVSEARVQNSLDALQTHGAIGYMKGTDVEQQVRDSLASTIYAGSNEIQRRIVGENLTHYTC